MPPQRLSLEELRQALALEGQLVAIFGDRGRESARLEQVKARELADRAGEVRRGVRADVGEWAPPPSRVLARLAVEEERVRAALRRLGYTRDQLDRAIATAAMAARRR
jgi:hypothetical protein